MKFSNHNSALIDSFQEPLRNQPRKIKKGFLLQLINFLILEKHQPKAEHKKHTAAVYILNNFAKVT